MRHEDTMNEIARAAFYRKQGRAAKFAGAHKLAHTRYRQARACMARASFIELESGCQLYRFPAPERAW